MTPAASNPTCISTFNTFYICLKPQIYLLNSRLLHPSSKLTFPKIKLFNSPSLTPFPKLALPWFSQYE